MKKVLTLTLLAATLLGACEKVENQTATQEQTLNRVVALSGNAKTGNSTHLFAMSMGHSSKDGSSNHTSIPFNPYLIRFFYFLGISW